MNTIVVLTEGFDYAQASISNAVKRYRDMHGLAWDVRLVTAQQLATAGIQGLEDAWWICRTPGALMHQRGLQNPVCALLGSDGPVHNTVCTFSEAMFGQMAAQHLFEQGYRFGLTIDISVRGRFDDRRIGFELGCVEHGMTYQHHVRPQHLSPAEVDAEIVALIRSAATPPAIYAVIDGQARWIQDVCLAAGVKIGEEVAILGTGDHTQECMQREPELSSVAYPWGLMGHTAARHVHFWMQGKQLEADVLRPYTVTERASTAARLPDDPLVARAISWMQQNLPGRQPVQQLCEVLGVAQSTLHRRFIQAGFRSPKDVHDSFRLARAEKLLHDKNMSLKAVAAQSGFSGTTPLGVAFKRRYGCSPTAWRTAVG